jgi:hypothetical protein
VYSDNGPTVSDTAAEIIELFVEVGGEHKALEM